MPAPILDAAGWSEVERTAVSLQSLRAAADAHRPSGFDAESWYATVRQRARRSNWPVGQVEQVTLARETRKAEAIQRAQAAGSIAQAVSRPVTVTPDSVTVLDAQVQAGENPAILSLKEKREYLAAAVRTPISEIKETSPLAHKIRRRTDKDGVETEEIESVPKLRALELDAKLAGELDGRGDDRRVMINIGILTQ
jgi:hypothetical protein